MDDSGDVAGVDDLYGLEPSAFTPARNDLVRRLKAAGRRDEAAIAAALRRPPATALALNQVARQDPDLVESALAAGARLRDATQAALGGDASAIREASAEERTASEALVVAADAHLGAGGQQVRARLSATVHAAVLDEAVADELRRGVLAADHDRSGLGLGADPGASPTPPRTRHLSVVDPAPTRRSRRASESADTDDTPRTDSPAAVPGAGANSGATRRRAAERARHEAKERARAKAEEQTRLAAADQARVEADRRQQRRQVNEFRTVATRAAQRAERLGRKADEAEALAAVARREADDAARVAADAARTLAETDRPDGGGGSPYRHPG